MVIYSRAGPDNAIFPHKVCAGILPEKRIKFNPKKNQKNPNVIIKKPAT
jgi:hypothetical protein